MKIGLVCPYNVAKGGGVQEIVRAMQEELLRRGHDCYIITPRPQDYDAEPGDHTIFIGGAADFNGPTHTTIQVSASVNETIHQMLEDEQFDVLHFHEPWVPMLSFQILTRSQAANVATFHAKMPEDIMSRSIARMITPYTKSSLKYLHALTAVSDAAAELVCRLTDEPVAIIPNAVTSKFSPPRSFADKRKHKTILFVGRLDARKGVKYLLRAFKLLQEHRPDVSLVIGGDGAERSKLEMLAADLELKNVQFLGYISDAEKIKLLQTSDLFCAPSLYGESFGIVLLEAMACGLVTVAGDNPGYESVLNGLGAISLVHPKHLAEFARRLELLLYEGDLRKLWREWAASEIPKYTYGRIVDQYLEVYEDAIAERKAHGSKT
ncbi:MAG TPA: glycosyltransferase family 4 protein [Candidatus Saccharimonadales bacterium]|nr:glycosyltransferase family 4 protein [Candidatus Saccharimonadales bacterium]